MFNIKHIKFGMLHMFVAMLSVLFVSGILEVPTSTAFIAVGISTLIFHFFTKNKLSTVLGLSATYLAPMLLIKAQFGVQAVSFGIFGIGIIYIGLSLLLTKYPNLLLSIPKYIFTLSVVFISLILIPVGFGMMKTPVGVITLVVMTLLTFSSKTKKYNVIGGVGAGLLAAFALGTIGHYEKAAFDIALVIPTFNLGAFTTISLVGIAVLGEVVGDVSATAELNKVTMGEDVGWNQVFLGMGIANVASSFFGVPTVSYTENNGFLTSSGHLDLDPSAQLYTAFGFIALGLIPMISGIFNIIPLAVFGAMLTFLFASLLFDNAKKLEVMAKTDKHIYAVVLLSAASLVLSKIYIASVSPITVAFAVALISHYLFTLKKGVTFED